MVMDFDKAKAKLKSELKETRYDHILRVVDTALKLNEDLNLNLDPKKVKYTALLHDSAKNVEKVYFDKYKEKYNLHENQVFEFPFLAHAILGPIVAKEEYGLDCIECLEAIRWHTTGRANMSILDKLIFIADYIEPGRDFEGLENIRKQIYKDFDLGFLMAIDSLIKHLLDTNAIINIETIEARNYLQGEMND